MSRRREVEQRLEMLGEVCSIMGSMKTLAMLETHKLERFTGTQRRVVDIIMAMAADYATFHPIPEPSATAVQVCLLVGSERGFCGDFNETLVDLLDERLPSLSTAPLVVTVGRKLAARFADDPRVVARLDGPSVAEEVEAVIVRLVESLNGLQAGHGHLSVTAFYHADHGDELRVDTLLPPFQDIQGNRRFTAPPLLNLTPEAFLGELIEHYLFAVLHKIFYVSLMAENLSRIRHLEGAIHHLEETTEALGIKRNILRQEEITEELEVIMLSADALVGEVSKQ